MKIVSVVCTVRSPYPCHAIPCPCPCPCQKPSQEATRYADALSNILRVLMRRERERDQEERTKNKNEEEEETCRTKISKKEKVKKQVSIQKCNTRKPKQNKHAHAYGQKKAVSRGWEIRYPIHSTLDSAPVRATP